MNTVADYPLEQIREIILEKVCVATNLRIDAEVLASSKLEVTKDAIGRIAYHFRSFIWAEPPTQVQVRYPSTWWDAFKERWFPAWAIEAYPPNYEIKTMEARHFYPALPQTHPDHMARLSLFVRDSTRNQTK